MVVELVVLEILESEVEVPVVVLAETKRLLPMEA